MARRYTTRVREEKAVEFKLTIENLEEYKNAWLVISNNIKAYPDSFYSVSNNYGDDIYVLCNPEQVDHVRSFLSQFGELNENHDRYAVFVDVSVDYQNFDKDYIDSDYILGETD